MKLCIPTMTENGADAEISGHFGSAPCFVLYDPKAKTCESLANPKADHEHGQCHPMDALAGRGITAVICKGMGKNAVAAVERQGIKVFTTQGTTVHDAIEAFMEGNLVKLDPESSCSGHGCH
ncbi:MAG: NifB/NifX family molybdenum-iron cluster-binding protein [Kiritimatiellales bacterium]|nr:NifB/NifX family molybdenum-iron cluster-binding protein [Kiritimatiellales bacterium]MCF7864305.1 NifB/NifX family molybdenum-iron cluster-binding protein [Kiritimatiellales bacterium]